MQLDRNGLEVLDRDECIALLATAPVARVGLSMQALPVILPVNFVIDGEEIIIRTTAGSKADAALHRAVVAIEADHYDTMDHSGWSVLVRGQTRLVDDLREIARLGELWLQAWATPEADRWLAIPMNIVTGRRIIRTSSHGFPPSPLAAGSFREPGSKDPAGFLDVDRSLDPWAGSGPERAVQRSVPSVTDADRAASREDPWPPPSRPGS